jgi:hypothetical protein
MEMIIVNVIGHCFVNKIKDLILVVVFSNREEEHDKEKRKKQACLFHEDIL